MRSQLYIIFQPKNYLKNGMIVILRGNFTLKFLKKMFSIYRLILTFVMNGQDNEYIKKVLNFLTQIKKILLIYWMIYVQIHMRMNFVIRGLVGET